MTNTGKMVYLALLLAAAIVLHIIEGMLPVLQIIILPGVKLGLANIITLLTLVLFGGRESILLVILRVLLASLLIGTFFTIPFFLSLAGAISSSLIMAGIYFIARDHLSIITISIIGAIGHNIAQLLTAAYIVEQIAVFAYLPYMLLLSLPTGFFIGLLVNLIIKKQTLKFQINKCILFMN